MKAKAIIYQQPRSTMQSGNSEKYKKWCLRFPHDNSRYIGSLMGWNASRDMKSSELRLKFDSLEQAKQFAQKKGYDFEVVKNKQTKMKPKSYADNFK